MEDIKIRITRRKFDNIYSLKKRFFPTTVWPYNGYCDKNGYPKN